MCAIAVVSIAGVGVAVVRRIDLPGDLCRSGKPVRLVCDNENPVMAVDAIGLTPRSPVMAEVGTFVIPDFVRMTKWAAAPRFTGAGDAARAGCPVHTRARP